MRSAFNKAHRSVRFSFARLQLEPVLKDVSFTVQAGERVGICGRTGSGKSTLALTFFRFLEADSGSIEIDGLDIGKMSLETLRSRLTIVAQDAQLFQGTVRLSHPHSSISSASPLCVESDVADQSWSSLLLASRRSETTSTHSTFSRTSSSGKRSSAFGWLLGPHPPHRGLTLALPRELLQAPMSPGWRLKEKTGAAVRRRR
jgi:ABC-type molybdenum transport system ATPase subunit/photorepair protein PhrA